MASNLRPVSQLRVPGRYREDLGPSSYDRPAFVHQEIPFNPELAPTCAFPTLPLDHPGLGPSEIWIQKWQKETLGGQMEEEQPLSDDATPDRFEGLIARADSVQAPSQRSNHGIPGIEYSGDKGPAQNEPLHAIMASQKSEETSPERQRGRRRSCCVNVGRRRSSVGVPGRRVVSLPTDFETINLPAGGDRDFFLRDLAKNLPDWSNLSASIKYIIIYEMVVNSGLSFIQATRQLKFKLEEVTEMIDLVRLERDKDRHYTSAILEYDTKLAAGLIDASEPVPVPSMITNVIKDAEIDAGQSFLRILGLKDVAARLGYHRGISGCFLDIPISHYDKDGHKSLPPHFNVGCREELLHMLRSFKQREAIRKTASSEAELQLRLVSPPRAVNPRRIDPSVLERDETGVYCNSAVTDMLTQGLHKDNLLLAIPGGRLVSAPDLLLIDDSVDEAVKSHNLPRSASPRPLLATREQTADRPVEKEAVQPPAGAHTARIESHPEEQGRISVAFRPHVRASTPGQVEPSEASLHSQGQINAMPSSQTEEISSLARPKQTIHASGAAVRPQAAIPEEPSLKEMVAYLLATWAADETSGNDRSLEEFVRLRRLGLLRVTPGDRKFNPWLHEGIVSSYLSSLVLDDEEQPDTGAAKAAVDGRSRSQGVAGSRKRRCVSFADEADFLYEEDADAEQYVDDDDKMDKNWRARSSTRKRKWQHGDLGSAPRPRRAGRPPKSVIPAKTVSPATKTATYPSAPAPAAPLPRRRGRPPRASLQPPAAPVAPQVPPSAVAPGTAASIQVAAGTPEPSWREQTRKTAAKRTRTRKQGAGKAELGEPASSQPVQTPTPILPPLVLGQPRGNMPGMAATAVNTRGPKPSEQRPAYPPLRSPEGSDKRLLRPQIATQGQGVAQPANTRMISENNLPLQALVQPDQPAGLLESQRATLGHRPWKAKDPRLFQTYRPMAPEEIGKETFE